MMNAATEIAFKEVVLERYPEMARDVGDRSICVNQDEVIRHFTEVFVDELKEWLKTESWMANLVKEHLSELDFGEIFLASTDDGLYFAVTRIYDEKGSQIEVYKEWDIFDVSFTTERFGNVFREKRGIEIDRVTFDGKTKWYCDMTRETTPDLIGKKIEVFDKEGKLVGTGEIEPLLTMPAGAVSAIANEHAAKRFHKLLSAKPEEKEKTRSPKP